MTESTPTQPKEDGQGLAITSLVLGILSWLLFSLLTSIPGVITGHMARSKNKENGLALAGLVIGYLNIVISIMGIIGIIVITSFGNSIRDEFHQSGHQLIQQEDSRNNSPMDQNL